MMHMVEGILACGFMLFVWWLVKMLNGWRPRQERDGDYYALLIAILVILNGLRLTKIERKIDEMNQCGPAEVTVSDE